MKLIFLNQFFYPDHSATSQLLADLAFGLADRGASVTVITSRLNYESQDTRLPPRETINGVDVERVWTSNFGRSHLVLRSIDYLTFYLSVIWALLRTVKRGDVVIAMTDPPMLSIVASLITKLRGARLITWLQDLFPEVAEALNVGGGLGALAFRPVRWLRNASLQHAALNVAIGDLMAERLAQFGIEPQRIQVIPNWADCDAIGPVESHANMLRADWNLSGDFVVGYSGNLGRAHDIETLLQAISATNVANGQGSSAHRIQWLFIGGGKLFEDLRREAADRNLGSIDFQPYQPRERLSQSLSAADVHIVSLRPELEGLIVPSKFYGVAAAGRPTLFIGAHDGEIARLIERHACGVTVAMGDGAGLAAAVTTMARDKDNARTMGHRARAACEALYSKTCAIEAWHQLLSDVDVDAVRGRGLRAGSGIYQRPPSD